MGMLLGGVGGILLLESFFPQRRDLLTLVPNLLEPLLTPFKDGQQGDGV